MSIRDTYLLIKTDLFRYAGKADWPSFFKYYLAEPGMKYIVWMRLCGYLKKSSGWKRGLYFPTRLIWMHYTYRFGMDIPPSTQIGGGFYIGHFGGIIVNRHVVIGKNCNISHGVTLGGTYRGKQTGFPTVGNNVFIGPGAKVFGKVHIGDNAAIGANAVVTKDVPTNTVAVGIPAQNVEGGSSEGYINNTDYEHIFSDKL